MSECTLIVSVRAGDQNTADRIAWALAGHVNAEFGAHTRRADQGDRPSRYEMTFIGWDHPRPAGPTYAEVRCHQGTDDHNRPYCVGHGQDWPCFPPQARDVIHPLTEESAS